MNPFFQQRRALVVSRGLWLWAALGLVGAMSAQTISVTLEALAYTGQEAPGTGGAAFGLLDQPTINTYGEVAFRGTLSGTGVSGTNDVGLWLGRTGQPLGLVAREGGAAPAYGVTGGTFALLDTPQVDDLGHVAFWGQLNENGSSVRAWSKDGLWQTASNWTPSATSLWIVVREQDTAMLARTGSTRSTSRWHHLISRPTVARDGTVFFAGTLKRNTSSTTVTLAQEGLWRYARPTTTPSSSVFPLLVGLEGEVAPGDTATTVGADLQGTALATTGELAFAGNMGTSGGQALWLGSPAGPNLLVRTGTTVAPRTGGSYALLGEPKANAEGHLAYWAATDQPGTPEGIFARKQGETLPLALAGKAAPGLAEGITFDGFFDPVLNERGTAAFLAQTSDGGQALYVGGTGSDLRLVAATGQPAPGLTNGATFALLGQPWLNRLGQVAFVGQLGGTGTGLGLWALDTNGALRLLLRQGQVVSLAGVGIRTVGRFSVGGWSDSGQAIAAATFTDGATAILRAGLSRPVLPDYATWAATNITGGLPSGAAQDANNDGVPNFLAFALGLSPTAPVSSAALPEFAVVDVAGLGAVPEGVTFRFRRRVGDTTTTYLVEASTDLVAWSTDPANLVESSAVLVGNGVEEVQVRDLSATSRTLRFLRLRVAAAN